MKIQEVAKTIQESVKNEVEKTTGLNVLFVNVHIEGVNLKNKNDDIKDDDEQYYEEDYSGQCDGGCSGCNGGCSVEDEDL